MDNMLRERERSRGKEQLKEHSIDEEGGKQGGRGRDTCMKMMKKGENIIIASMETILTGFEEPPASFW